MDLTIQVISAREFVRAICDNDLDSQNTGQMLLAVVSVKTLSGYYDALVDCRKAANHLSLADVTNVVEVMTDNRRLFHRKLAILAPAGDGYETMKFMETYATNRGLQIAAFKDYEQAINWLMPATTIPPAS